jgi:maleate isomerase
MTNAATRHHRIGMIVPSSNTTMEIELPELLRRQQRSGEHRFSFHSARVRLTQVTPEALARMNESADDAMDALCDAQVDALLYACLVAVMSGGRHRVCETLSRLQARAACTDRSRPGVITSAGALVAALKSLSATRITMITPYRKVLTEQVTRTLLEYGIEVRQSRSLEVVDNVQVGRLDQAKLLSIASQLDYSGSDALVISACVQMPSLDVIEEAEQKLGLPVISAATASAHELLSHLDIEPDIANAGALLRPGAKALHKAVAP